MISIEHSASPDHANSLMVPPLHRRVDAVDVLVGAVMEMVPDHTDPRPWATLATLLLTALSFINCTSNQLHCSSCR